MSRFIARHVMTRVLATCLSVVVVSLIALGSLALIGHVGLMGFVELRQERNVGHQGMDLLQHFIFHSQGCIIIPDLEQEIKI